MIVTEAGNNIIEGVLVGLGFLGLLYASVINLIFIYKIWQAIADEYARTTPGKAIGFLFIPLFNLFWIFEVLWGFAKDCNNYIKSRSLAAKPLPEGMFLACSILVATSGIPYLGILCGLAYSVLWIIVVSRTCDTINAFDETIAPPSLSLHFLSGEFVNDTLNLPSSGLTIGRDPAKANLIFKSKKISGLHTKLTPDGKGQVWVEDMDSLNGTFYRQQQSIGQNIAWNWIQLHGQMLLAVGARLRLADDAGEFEIRKQ
jgi:hypothetical protein